MGNNISSTRILVTTNKKVYNAGEQLTGTVYVHENDKDGRKIESLEIYVMASEKVSVHYSTHAARKTIDHWDNQEHCFFSIGCILATFPNNILEPGQYEFPFDAILPNGLPATKFHEFRKSSLKIEYEVKVVLKYADDEGDNVATCVIKVLPEPRPSNYLEGPVVQPPVIKQIKVLGGLNLGTMILTADVDNGVVLAGDVMSIGVGIRNDSKVAIHHVDVWLLESFELRGRRRTGKSTEYATRRHIEKKDIKLYGESLDENGNRIGNLKQVKLKVPARMMANYSGKMIKISHKILVRAETTTTITNPKVELEIFVQLPPGEGAESNPVLNASSENYTKPKDWKPRRSSLLSIPTRGSRGSISSLDSLDLKQIQLADQVTTTTFEAIKEEIDISFDPCSLIQELSEEPPSLEILANLTPEQYATLLKTIASDVDKPKCAKLLAEKMGDNFTCAHIVAVCAEFGLEHFYLTNVINATAPLACDLGENKSLIKEKLDDFKQLQCAVVLD